MAAANQLAELFQSDHVIRQRADAPYQSETGLCCQVLHDVTRDSAANVDATDAQASTGAVSAADPAAMLPHLLELLRQTSLMVNELLRHFWGCFPVSSKPRLDKLRRVHKGLSEQHNKCASSAHSLWRSLPLQLAGRQ